MNHRMTPRISVCLPLAVCLIVTGLLCEGVSAASVADLVEQVSLESYTNYLQNDLYAHDGDERRFGPQHDPARQRIQERFEGFGLATSLQPFAYEGTICYNVVGVHRGVSCPDEIYVLGAHYDTVEGCPGACDNASGVAGVLEAARVLSQHAFEATLVFIAFDREEQWMVGSSAYANEHTQDRIRGMITIDSIAWRAYGPEHPDYNKICVDYSSTRTRLIDDLAGAIESYAGLTSVVGSSGNSDHASFDDAGFAAAYLLSYDSENNLFWHTALDSVDQPDYIDYDHGTRVTRAVVGCLATAAKLAPARILPDFDGDGDVDIDDCCLLIEHWKGTDPRFDIAPPPTGDGAVDTQDLDALLHYWRTDRSNWWPEFGLLAHWKLDETEGEVAQDSAEIYPGTVHGGPVWEPGKGRIDGTLRFDGFDDYISTPFVLYPSKSFSVFAWVKGGGPGQVILSQAKDTNWLLVSPADTLMTDLRLGQGKGLSSGSIITDGNWHRVGFVWDGSHRILYVDDVKVAQDTQTGLTGSFTGLHIGAGGTLAPGSLWSGLIDDTRIYQRALSAEQIAAMNQ